MLNIKIKKNCQTCIFEYYCSMFENKFYSFANNKCKHYQKFEGNCTTVNENHKCKYINLKCTGCKIRRNNETLLFWLL